MNKQVLTNVIAITRGGKVKAMIKPAIPKDSHAAVTNTQAEEREKSSAETNGSSAAHKPE